MTAGANEFEIQKKLQKLATKPPAKKEKVKNNYQYSSFQELKKAS